MLRGQGPFVAVLQSGHRIGSRNFVVRARPNGLAYCRLGIVAGRKAAPRAVDRNRVKRLIRETFRESLDNLGACDLTVQLRTDLRTESGASIRAELRRLLGAAGERCGSTSRVD